MKKKSGIILLSKVYYLLDILIMLCPIPPFSLSHILYPLHTKHSNSLLSLFHFLLPFFLPSVGFASLPCCVSLIENFGLWLKCVYILYPIPITSNSFSTLHTIYTQPTPIFSLFVSLSLSLFPYSLYPHIPYTTYSLYTLFYQVFLSQYPNSLFLIPVP